MPKINLNNNASNKMGKLFLIIAGVSGLLSVVLGAFGAHGLKGKIADNLLNAFQTGTQYQMFHSLALLGLAILLLQLSDVSKMLSITGYFWIVGMVLFSGSLYGLALGGPVWLGPITPIGGLLLILGWFCLIIGAFRL
jgi:uncharacterized membrane protein YgdD (TMEM256/DUF423 family)